LLTHGDSPMSDTRMAVVGETKMARVLDRSRQQVYSLMT
jgi:hypothetical protein